MGIGRFHGLYATGKVPISHPLVIAHRGASGRFLENSRAAFQASIDMGVDGIELDVHATADGTVVVHHDADVAGRPIASLTDSDIPSITLDNGEPLPRLCEVLALVGTTRVFVEVKELAPQWDRQLIDVLDRGPAPDGYAVHSFDHRVLARLGQLRPDLPRGILLCSRPVDPTPLLAQTGATTVWQERQWVDAALVDQIHDKGATVIVWTVDDDEEIERMKQLEVDGVCGNYPDRLRRIIGGDDG